MVYVVVGPRGPLDWFGSLVEANGCARVLDAMVLAVWTAGAS
jgi:hypothetical protein